MTGGIGPMVRLILITGMGEYGQGFRDTVCAYGHLINLLVHDTRKRVEEELLKRGR